MDMWCPYGIGREILDREVLRVVCSPFSPRGGDLPSGCVSVGLVQASVTTGELLLLLLLLLYLKSHRLDIVKQSS